MKPIVSALLALALLLWNLGDTHAQSVAPLPIPFSAGWNMAGGPPGTTFTGAIAVDTYSAAGYQAASPQITDPCQGRWVYYAAPATIPLPIVGTATQNCPLVAGWNLVGNPFSSSIQLPANTVAYYWNAQAQQYVSTLSIPLGGAAWIYSPVAATLLLQNPAPSSTAPVTFEFDNLPTVGALTMHVGDTIKFLLPSAIGYDLSNSDNSVLQLVGAGPTGNLTCSTDPTCATTLTDVYWIYQAVAPGEDLIVFTPKCVTLKPPCELPSRALDITVVK